MITREAIEAAVTEALEGVLRRRLKGGLGDGRWYALTIHQIGGGVEITERREASPCYSESEYYAKPGHPVTFWTCQEYYSPSPESTDLERVECAWGEAEYAHPANNWDVYAAAGAQDIEDSVDRHLGIVVESLQEARDAFIAAGWVPFKLGDPVDPIDVTDAVEEAVKEICEAWAITHDRSTV